MKDTLLGLLACAALVVLGGLMLAKPSLLWKLEHFLDVRDGHPSEWYEAKCRFGGVFFFLIGLLGLLFFGAAAVLTLFA